MTKFLERFLVSRHQNKMSGVRKSVVYASLKKIYRPSPALGTIRNDLPKLCLTEDIFYH